MSDLLRLAERVEMQSGANSDVDRSIQAVLAGAIEEWQDTRDSWAYHRDGHWVSIGPILPYTASLDAAMRLVPEGIAWTIDGGDPACQDSASLGYAPEPGRLMNPSWTAGGDTPALALCAASLRARAEIERLKELG